MMDVIGPIIALTMVALVVVLLGVLGWGLYKDHKKASSEVDPESTEACMAWVNLQRSKAVNINAETWDEKYLHSTVEEYWKYPRAKYMDVEAAKNVTETLNWLKDNDPSAMRARIAELERELGIR